MYTAVARYFCLSVATYCFFSTLSPPLQPPRCRRFREMCGLPKASRPRPKVWYVEKIAELFRLLYVLKVVAYIVTSEVDSRVDLER